jgi:LysM repeat protein
MKRALPVVLSIGALLAAIWAVRLNMMPAAYEADSSTIPASTAQQDYDPDLIHLPEYRSAPKSAVLARSVEIRTVQPTRARIDVLRYTVQPGDSVFGIADKFTIEPETVLWGNYETLNDDPHLLRPGQELNILPVDGTYYQWQAGDSLLKVADYFDVAEEEISSWPGNKLDPSNPELKPGDWVIVPGGQRAFQQWLVPTIARGQAGVGSAFGPGACTGTYSGAVGTGGFIWPAPNHYVSGNDYWSGHLAIDIAAGVGTGVSAADSGVVVFAGWSTVGYGNMVMLDHGNGWQSLYSHLSQVNVGCGQSVLQGQSIGLAGSTGNSTGPHLHFEVRYEGGFVNPWFVLP